MASLDWQDTESSHVQDLLAPLAFRHLYHLGAAAALDGGPGRYKHFHQCVLEAYGEDIDELSFNVALQRVLLDWPGLIGQGSADSTSDHGIGHAHVPVAGPAVTLCSTDGCARKLAAIKSVGSIFVTLARGMLPGEVSICQCAGHMCDTVHCGPWRWDGVPPEAASGSDRQGLPGSYWHRPVCTMTPDNRHAVKWFFIDPAFVVEVSLLTMLTGFMCRGGLSVTAFHAVYLASCDPGAVPQQYSGDSGSQNFSKHMLQVIVVWGVICMMLDSMPAALGSVPWYFRGADHRDVDFAGLVEPALLAFKLLAQGHSCELWRKFHAAVVDGKWGFQSLLCADRSSAYFFDHGLRLGFHCGCTAPPAAGERFCGTHLGELRDHGGRCVYFLWFISDGLVLYSTMLESISCVSATFVLCAGLLYAVLELFF